MRPTLCALCVCVLSVWLCPGCDGDDPATVDGTLAACDCAPPAAVDVSYDDTASELDATELQSAVEALAARSAPSADAFARITVVDNMVSSSAADVFPAVATCPAGQIAIGGACSDGLTGQSIAYTRIVDNAYHCAWNNPANEVGVELTATAVCLAPPAP